MIVCVVGLWHLGCVTTACLAAAGHQVIAVDFDAATISTIHGFCQTALSGLGVAADVSSRYNFALRYIALYGGYASNAAGAMVVPESVSGGLSDRGHLMFTFKTTF